MALLAAAACGSPAGPSGSTGGEGGTSGAGSAAPDCEQPESCFDVCFCGTGEREACDAACGGGAGGSGGSGATGAGGNGGGASGAGGTGGSSGAGCVPSCEGKVCGDDGCGSTCGQCPAGTMCTGATCEAAPPSACAAPVPEPTFPSTKKVSSTIIIDTPGVHDFGNVLHEWDGPGSCNQTENQPYVLRIAASNVTLRNFAYRNAPDGIHIGTSSDGQGYSEGETLTNIVLENVTGWACEDALTTQYGVRDVTIRDSQWFANPNAQYRDKLLQLNFGDVTIERSTFAGGNGGTCVMFKGSQNIHIVDSCFSECDRAVNGSTQHGILGKIGTGRSELRSERNVGTNPGRFIWDPWQFLTADGDVHMHSSGDLILDNGVNKASEGATLLVD